MRRVQRALYAVTDARSARRGIRENCKTLTKDNYVNVVTMSMKRSSLNFFYPAQIKIEQRKDLENLSELSL